MAEGAGSRVAAMEAHLFWIASRASGIAALLLSSAAVGVGLTMGGRLVKGRGLDLRAAHEALSLATLVAIVVHAVAVVPALVLLVVRHLPSTPVPSRT
jgi:succinate dehydrogenase hydrophobic anchor subunit